MLLPFLYKSKATGLTEKTNHKFKQKNEFYLVYYDCFFKYRYEFILQKPLTKILAKEYDA